MEQNAPVFGIDLGTTNSCISVISDENVRVLPVEGQPTMPSVVALRDGEWLVGQAARNYLKVNPSAGVCSIKRKMDEPNYTIKIGSHSLTPIDVSAKILKKLAKEAEAATGSPVKDVVITVPAWFQDTQRQATIAAGKQAGLHILQIVNEPTAAAIAHNTVQIEEGQEEKWVVYDLGGGTFDVSVLNVTSTAHEVLASAGNSFLGGDDFDGRLAERFSAILRDQHNVDPSGDLLAATQLKFLAEQVKMRLSSELKVDLQEPIVVAGKSYTLGLTFLRSEFESLISDLLDSSLEKVSQVMSEARLQASDIDRLLLVGGSTRIPMIADALANRFACEPESWVDPDQAVALGAAIQAAITTGQYFQRDVVDICPHSLGIAAFGYEDEDEDEDEADEDEGFSIENIFAKRFGNVNQPPKTFVPLVRRNSRLPASFVRGFYKGHPQQEVVQICVFQGESSNTRNNTFIGDFYVPLTNMSDNKIEVRFSYDLNGVIRIGVEEGGVGTAKNYSMDLSRSADENSERDERPGFVEDEIDDDNVIELVAKTEAQATNYLVSQVQKKLTQENDEEMAKTLQQYQQLLVNNDDDALDELEEKLYDWLESEPSHPGV